jgi:hypothetical protein
MVIFARFDVFYFNKKEGGIMLAVDMGYSAVKAVSEVKRVTMPSVVGCARNAC